MKKITMMAAVLAMMAFAAVPALAHGTDQSLETFQVTAAGFGDQSVDQSVVGDGNETAAVNNQQQASHQTVQNAQADDGSLAANADDVSFDGGYYYYFWLF